ncbi:hypothetical protein GNF76_20615 [Pseudomonas sp. CCM 7893]|uniref:FUSC family protein n=2 Tax=Pseudomonas spelaei TaxID=1055469 RepID=A0A6I3WHL3_9PSED|nr:hypothetical protein [Pseudomonas spelaei]
MYGESRGKPIMTTTLKKITYAIPSINVSYSLRLTASVLLSWLASFELNLDKPYWSIMTAIIVCLPSDGAVFTKLMARLAGTLCGVVTITIFANINFNDPILLSLAIIIWMCFCGYLAALNARNLSYFFALSGYTVALLGFSLSAAPEPQTVFFITQARFSEVVVGLIAVAIISYLFPSRVDREKYDNAINKNKADIAIFFEQCLLPDKDIILTKIHSLLNRTLTLKQVIENLRAAPFLHKTDDKTHYTVNIPGRLRSIIESAILHALYTDLKKSTSIASLIDINSSEGTPKLENHSLTMKERYFLYYYNKSKHSALFLNPTSESRQEHQLIKAKYRDYSEAFRGALRVFFSISLGVFFWLSTDWTSGVILPILISIICSLFITNPIIEKLLILVALVTLLACITSFIFLFYAFIGYSEIFPAIISFLSFIVAVSILQMKGEVLFAILFVYMIETVFLIGFTNPMTFDFSSFANSCLAVLTSIGILIIIFYLVPPGSSKNKIARMRTALTNRYCKRLGTYESHRLSGYIYSMIPHAEAIPSTPEKDALLKTEVNGLLILKTLAEANEALGHPLALPKTIESLDQLAEFDFSIPVIIDAMNAAAPDEYVYWWQLYAIISRAFDV